MCLKKTKINEKEGGVGPFKKLIKLFVLEKYLEENIKALSR